MTILLRWGTKSYEVNGKYKGIIKSTNKLIFKMGLSLVGNITGFTICVIIVSLSYTHRVPPCFGPKNQQNSRN